MVLNLSVRARYSTFLCNKRTKYNNNYGHNDSRRTERKFTDFTQIYHKVNSFYELLNDGVIAILICFEIFLKKIIDFEFENKPTYLYEHKTCHQLSRVS